MTASAPIRSALSRRDGDEIDDHDMAYAKGFEGQRRAQPDRPRTEYGDLVRRFGFALVGAVARDGHRFVECGDFPRDVLGDHFETGSTNGVFDQQVVSEGPGGSPIADDAAGGGHGIDDDVIAHGDARHIGADLDDFACGFVAERRVPLARRDAADGDVERVGAADSAGAHLDERRRSGRPAGVSASTTSALPGPVTIETFMTSPRVRCQKYPGIRRRSVRAVRRSGRIGRGCTC